VTKSSIYRSEVVRPQIFFFCDCVLLLGCFSGCGQCPSDFSNTNMPKVPGKLNTPPVEIKRPMGSKTLSGAKSNNTGSPGPPNSAPTPGVSEGFKCGCGRSYALKASLARHKRDCGSRDTSKCQWCDATFASYAGVRQHERKAHPPEFQMEQQAQMPAPESELMTKIADVEVRASNGIFYKEMMASTGLTHQQVRSRREKPEYRHYLEKARVALAKSKKVSPPTVSTGAVPKRTAATKAIVVSASSSRLSSQPLLSCSKQVRKDQASPLSKAGPPKAKAEGKRIPINGAPPPVSMNLRGKRTCVPARPSPASGGGRSPLITPGPNTTIGPTIELPMSDLNPETPDLPGNTPKSLQIMHAKVQREEMLTTPEKPVTENQKLTPNRMQLPSANTNATPPEPYANAVNILPVRSLRARPRRSRSLPPTPRPAAVSDGNGRVGPQGLALFLLSPEPAVADALGRSESLAEMASAALNADDIELSRIVDKWLQKLAESTQYRRKGRRPKRNRGYHYAQTNTGSGQRASFYKKCQDLFQKNRRGLAEMILTGREETDVKAVPSVSSVEALYGGIFESPSPPDDEPYEQKRTGVSEFAYITLDEIRAAKSGWSVSAPGVDRVSVATVKNMSEAALAVLFNAVVFRNVQPASWKLLRTTLVPKEGDLRDPGNWRPITIGSAVQRLLHRVLAARLSKYASLSSSQRGFTEIDGTLANAMILHEYLQGRVLGGKAYSIVSLDVRKAFDTVSHCSISRALGRFGVPNALHKYIMATFDASTAIKVGSAVSRPIGIRRGVRQGDPLSPILFNICMDELLERINEKYQGGSLHNGERNTIMAFADDLIITADRDIEVPLILEDVSAFLERRGMAINPSKCRALVAGVVRGRSVPRTRPNYSIYGKPIPNVDAFNAFRYLGHEFGHKGVERPSILNLTNWLANIKKAPLKPDQKLTILKLYVIPRLLYGLQNPKVTSRTLRDGDRLIRKAIKGFYHLNAHTPDALIHASVRDGGLGVMELRRAIPRIFLGRLVNLMEKDGDLVLSSVLQSDRNRSLMIRLSGIAGDVPETTHWRDKIASGALSKGLEQTSEDSSSRLWISDRPTGWSGRDHVRAVQLRTANLPTKAIPSVPVGQRRCRHGCAVDESIAHVLQTCPLTHGSRIRRHNEVVAKIARHCKTRGWAVEDEPHIRSPCGQLFKPDLAVHLPGGTTVIADVQVAWDSESLRIPYERKRAKYDVPPFHKAAKRSWPGKKLVFAPIILGARGIWPRLNSDRSSILEIPPAVRRSCVNSVLKWGSSIHAEFSRSVWAKRLNPRPAP
jgi:hypothetical protein